MKFTNIRFDGIKLLLKFWGILGMFVAVTGAGALVFSGTIWGFLSLQSFAVFYFVCSHIGLRQHKKRNINWARICAVAPLFFSSTYGFVIFFTALPIGLALSVLQYLKIQWF